MYARGQNEAISLCDINDPLTFKASLSKTKSMVG